MTEKDVLKILESLYGRFPKAKVFSGDKNEVAEKMNQLVREWISVLGDDDISEVNSAVDAYLESGDKMPFPREIKALMPKKVVCETYSPFGNPTYVSEFKNIIMKFHQSFDTQEGETPPEEE